MNYNSDNIIRRQIDALNNLSLNELKNKFTELFGFECSQTSIRNLRKRLAYRLQEIKYGGLAAEVRKRLEDIAERDSVANFNRAGASPRKTLKGTRLSRVWKGTQYEVIALGDGKFEYDGRAYQSLSAIAREITGTRWNGKLFFGVK